MRNILRWLIQHPDKLRLLIAGLAFAAAALSAYVTVSGVFEYLACVNERVHAATSYAEDDAAIHGACRALHLWFIPEGAANTSARG